jgi:hypothetical protein
VLAANILFDGDEGMIFFLAQEDFHLLIVGYWYFKSSIVVDFSDVVVYVEVSTRSKRRRVYGAQSQLGQTT